jgi:hypothetical protein
MPDRVDDTFNRSKSIGTFNREFQKLNTGVAENSGDLNSVGVIDEAHDGHQPSLLQATLQKIKWVSH